MRPSLHVARICAAAIVLMAISLVPSVTSAHVGHAHPQAVPAARAKHEATVKTVPQAHVTAWSALPTVPPEDASCGGLGCCSNGPCSGCHGGLLTVVPIAAPPFLGATLSAGDARAGPLPRNGRLLRPPKSFV
jgi:hypothetical protein